MGVLKLARDCKTHYSITPPLHHSKSEGNTADDALLVIRDS